MRTETQHPLVTRYLKDLERALRDVPAEDRHEIVADIKEHIAEAAADRGDEMTENELRRMLEQVGHPEAIAEEARERFGVTRRRGGAMEGIAVVSLLFGGLLIPILGWVLGVILLWASSVWTTREKIIGTLIVPGGLAAPLFFGAFAVGASSCIGPPGSGCTGDTNVMLPQFGGIILIALGLAPIAVAVYLARKAFRA